MNVMCYPNAAICLHTLNQRLFDFSDDYDVLKMSVTADNEKHFVIIKRPWIIQ